MFRRFLCLSAGTIALIAVLAAPGQLHAAHMARGGGTHMVHPSMHSTFMHGSRGRFDPRFNRRFDPRFNRGFFLTPGMNRGFFDPRIGPTFGPIFFRPF
jgi:hypothetical protein